MSEITEEALIELGFFYVDFPCLRYIVNDRDIIEVAYAEGNWYWKVRDGLTGLVIPLQTPHKISEVENLIYFLTDEE